MKIQLKTRNEDVKFNFSFSSIILTYLMILYEKEKE